jgi:hypothetical protein|tara:strand:- start:3350 stop:3529 length:180 start_codon:yes stop_codon:yes gene_type:complete
MKFKMPLTYYETIKKIRQKMKGVEDKEVRTRDSEGKFVGDDPSTPDVNEAYETIEVKKK